MSERGDIARDLVESVRKEAVGEVAKGVVRGVKAALVAALAAICALAWSLWTANPVATVSLAVVSLAFGAAVGSAIGWRRACRSRDAEHERALAEKDAEMGALRAEKDAEMSALRAERDAEIDRLRRNVVGLEDVDSIMRYLPESLGDILATIYASGGSMVLPLGGELRDLVDRRVLRGTEGPDGAWSWSLPAGVMRWFRERDE